MLPAAWVEAFLRDAEHSKPPLADPLPERRVARLLGAWIVAGLFFLVLPGTVLGVWNLVSISSRQDAQSIPANWIQAHGHAQLLGWVGTFMIGISLYAVPKFRGGAIRSLAVGWAMLALWTSAIALRWWSGVEQRAFEIVWPLAASAELVVALLLVWQTSARGASYRRTELWNHLIFAGHAGLVVTLALQLALVWPPLAQPLIPPEPNARLLYLALWAFCFPVVWGFSTRFLPTLLGLPAPGRRAAYAGLAALAGAIIASQGLASALTILAVVLACWSLRIFHPSQRPAKTAFVDPLYGWFTRAAFGWMTLSALLLAGGDVPGMTGASRHAFTVGFLATMIFSIGPRVLPAFLNSRELWSTRLMRASLVLLTLGCTLRVTSEPLAYASAAGWAWKVLPVSAMIELTAVLLFAYNLGRTLATPMPAWFGREQVRDSMTLYWYVSAYPATRELLIRAGLKTLAATRRIPMSLTLREAAECDGVDPGKLVAALADFFAARTARAVLGHNN